MPSVPTFQLSPELMESWGPGLSGEAVGGSRGTNTSLHPEVSLRETKAHGEPGLGRALVQAEVTPGKIA